jgi:hypothetical protein
LNNVTLFISKEKSQQGIRSKPKWGNHIMSTRQTTMTVNGLAAGATVSMRGA